ncbi:MAG: MFS transporter [Bacteroidales bacterium]
MTEKVTKLMKDSTLIRWIALILLASMMFFAYMFVDVLSPLQSMLEVNRGWTPENYGMFASSEYFLNVFAFFLIFAGIILDKMGIRFTAILSGIVMVVGASIKYYAISDYFMGSGLESTLNSFWTSFPASAKLASLGFMIFGCGVEMAGITVSKAIVKWFNGKELALAMGIEMAIARLGVFAVFRISPRIADMIPASISRPVLFCCILLFIGLICFIIYSLMDKKLDKQMGESGIEPEEPFKISDIGILFTSKTFLIVAGLCVLYYSAIFPFQKFAANMLECRLGISNKDASDIFSWFPIGAMLLTPLLGAFLDNKGKGATMLIIGAVLMCCCHLIFALVPAESFTPLIAYSAIIILGVSFSLVPAALWPSVPKLVENRYLGSAYSVIFWIQNIGLMVFPMLIGWALTATNVGVANPKEYNYMVPMLIFACLGVLAFILGLWLKAEDKKKGYGLELPNIKK